MRRNSLFLTLAIGIVILCGGNAFAQNYKITQKVSVSGQEMTNTTYVRGQRKRTETGGMFGMGVANIEQCDLKQYVRVNDKKKLYTVDPFDTGEPATKPAKPTAPVKAAPKTKGGVVTYKSNITDTGERKQMFGMTARHLKTTTSMESSPDACNKTNMQIQTDGWYIDLPEFSCPISFGGSTPQYRGADGGCQDKVVSSSTGGGKLGFPLSETRTMTMEGNSFSQSTETIEFSKAVLEPTLFDIPTGYTLAADQQSLYSMPDYASMANDSGNLSSAAPSSAQMPSGSAGKSPKANFTGPKVGIVIPTNRGDSVSLSELQSILIQELDGPTLMAVAVSSEADARTMGLEYVLTTDIVKLKQSKAGKIGGLFGSVAGVPTAGSFDAQVEYKLVKISDGKVVLQSKAANKSETDAMLAARKILGMEATAVLGAIR